jgi:branched-subunit amino acid transport protein
VSAVWITVAGLALATALIKAAGPVLLGGRELPPALTRLIALLPAALLAALVVTETFGTPGASGVTVDARAAGLLAAGAALALRASLVVTIVAAAVAAAAVRALT